MLEQWSILLAILLGPMEEQPTPYDITLLIDMTEEINAQLRVQT